MINWRTDEPPKGEEIELLCVLFDEDSYRTLEKNPWGEWNRTIHKGKWNGHHFTGYREHVSGDPFPSVVAWRPLNKEDMGEEYYPKCLGAFLDY